MEAADGSPPVVQLMSMLRQTVENLRMQDDTLVDNDNVQAREPRLRLRAMPPRWKFVTYRSVKSDRLVPTSASGNGNPQKREYPLDFSFSFHHVYALLESMRRDFRRGTTVALTHHGVRCRARFREMP
jgi:hypothetical protein